MTRLLAILGILGIVSGVVAFAGERVSASRDGMFASKRPSFSTSLNVLEGTDEALVYYGGGFGPGCLDAAKGGWCRSCELGPVLAPRESSGGFLIASEGGKARLVARDGVWQLRLAEGTADWCGVGWSGDDFKTKGEDPQSCAVATDDGELLAPGADAGAPPRRTVARGERLVALDALPTDEPLLLVKVQSIVGVMRRKDLSCEVERAR